MNYIIWNKSKKIEEEEEDNNYMKIDKVVVGELEENCYVLGIDDNVLVIDPGDEFNKINEVVNNRKVLGILVTHNHFDHVGALNEFNNIDIYFFDNLEEKEYNIGPFKFNVIYNPGHTDDSISFYFKEDKTLFCGDFIFYHSIGRWDLPTGDFNKMKESITKIKKLPEDTIIYPGHNRSTTLKDEIDNNYYF